jgi:hypothetical protein
MWTGMNWLEGDLKAGAFEHDGKASNPKKKMVMY